MLARGLVTLFDNYIMLQVKNGIIYFAVGIVPVFYVPRWKIVTYTHTHICIYLVQAFSSFENQSTQHSDHMTFSPLDIPSTWHLKHPDQSEPLVLSASLVLTGRWWWVHAVGGVGGGGGENYEKLWNFRYFVYFEI